jgi:hypothetical protein
MPLPYVITLDYDMPYNNENMAKVIEEIKFTSYVLGIPIKKVYIRKSANGKIHVYIHLFHKAHPVEHMHFEYFSHSDRGRLYANYRRYYTGYPSHGNPFYLFDTYYRKPPAKNNCHIEYPLWDIALYYFVKYQYDNEIFDKYKEINIRYVYD